MQGRGTPAPEPDCAPGPGAYTANPVSTKPAAPAFTIATRPAETDTVARATTPAPGEYHGAGGTSLGGPAFSIPVALVPVDTTAGVYAPGPGEYERPAAAAGPAYSIPRAPARGTVGGDCTDAPDLPGPSDYAAAQLDGGPAYTIPHTAGRSAPADAQMAVSPGPGQYGPAELQHGPAFTIAGRVSHEDAQADCGLGPGAYNVLQPAAGPAFTMQVRAHNEQRCESVQKFIAMASFACCLVSPRHCKRCVRCSKLRAPQDRSAIANQHSSCADSPGPGAYTDAPTQRGPAYTVPQSGVSDDVAPRQATPGPGEYACASIQPGPAYSIPAAAHSSAQHDAGASPGPGEYDANGTAKDGPAYSIPKAAATDISSAHEALPGPADYARDSSKPVQHGPAYSLGARWREEKPLEDTSALPGPQDYTLCPTEPGPAFTIGGKRGEPAVGDTPGPGSHTVATGDVGPAYTIAGKHPAAVGTGMSSPGPAAYTAPVRAAETTLKCLTPQTPLSSCQGRSRCAGLTQYKFESFCRLLAGSRQGPGIHSRRASFAKAVR